jgi:membrane protease YdiL (CAAX protease family)
MNQKTTKNNLNGGFAFLIMIALFMLVSFIGQSILTSAGVTEGRLFYAVSATFSSIAILVVLLYAKKTLQKPLLAVVNANKTKPVYFGLAVILSVGMFLGLGFLNTTLANVFAKWGLKISQNNVPLQSVLDVVLFGVLLAVFPAVLEECFFRGVMLNGTDSKGFKAVLSVSVCFALYHGSIATLFYQFIYGFALTFLAVKSGSILPSILAHFINNFAVIIFTFFGVSINLFSPIIICIGLAILVCFWVGALHIDKDKNFKQSSGVKDFWFPSGIMGVSIMALLILLNAFA